MLYRQRLGIVFFFLSMLLSSCQLLQQRATDVEPESKKDAMSVSPSTAQAAASISGYPTSGSHELTVNPSNHQLSVLPHTKGGAASVTAAIAAREASPLTTPLITPAVAIASPVRPAPFLAPPSSVDSIRQESIVDSLAPVRPDPTVRVSTGSKQSAWLGGVAGAGSAAITDPLAGMTSDHSTVLISSMRHPKTPGVNMPEEEKASSTRELTPRPNKAELRGLRAPKLKSTVPLPHE